MAGVIKKLIGMTTYDWSNLAAGGSQTVVLADLIDLSVWKEGQLIVRVHTQGMVSSGPSAVVDMVGIDPAEDDPAVEFLTSSSILTAAANITVSTAAPKLFVLPLSPNFGLMGRVQLTMSQDITGAMAASCVISVELVLKTDGPPLSTAETAAGRLDAGWMNFLTPFEQFYLTRQPGKARVVDVDVSRPAPATPDCEIIEARKLLALDQDSLTGAAPYDISELNGPHGWPR